MKATRVLIFFVPLFLFTQVLQAYSFNDAVVLAQDNAAVAAFDDLASMYKNQPSVTGSVASNDKGALYSSLDSSPVGQYGSLLFDSTGGYTYVLNSNSSAIASLQANQSLTETFHYTIRSQNHSSSAKLVIHILGISNNEFYALNDEISIFALATSPVIGDVTSNDLGFKTVEIRTNGATAYGTLSFDSAGAFSYAVRENLNLPEGTSYDDVFVYRIYNETGLFDEATITIHILGQTAPQETPEEFTAENDVNTITKNAGGGVNGTTTVVGNLLGNDIGAVSSFLVSSATSDVGSLAYDTSGSYTYTLFNESQRVRNLGIEDTITDTYTYQITSAKGSIKQATLTITILGAPGEITSGVEIEPNNTSSVATPINITVPANEAHSVKGNLNSGEDKDWYSMQSLGDEIIHFDLCPPASTCYDGKAWVLYIFDEQRFTASAKEGNTVTLRLTGDDTGLGYGSGTESNHLYLNYNVEYFADSIIGIIDPCFGGSTSLDIGVGSTSKTYLIAISSPLKRSGTGCEDGSVVLEKAGPKGSYIDGAGDPQTEDTTQEYISYFPNSDDQYIFSVTRTGPNPVRSSTVRSASYNSQSGVLNVPIVRVGDEMYSADLIQSSNQNRSLSTDKPQFLIGKLEKLEEELNFDSGFATYNPASNVVYIPKYFDEQENEYKYLILLYHPSNGTTQEWLEFLYSDTLN